MYISNLFMWIHYLEACVGFVFLHKIGTSTLNLKVVLSYVFLPPY